MATRAQLIVGDIVINMNGAEAAEAAITAIEKKVTALTKAMGSMSLGNDLSNYWNSQKSSIDGVSEAFDRFNRISNEANAGALIKSFNSFVAQGGDVTDLLEKYGEGINGVIEKAGKMAPAIKHAFNVNDLKEAFDSFQYLSDMGMDMNDVFKKLNSVESNGLRDSIKTLSTELANLKRDYSDVKSELSDLQQTYADLQESYRNLQADNQSLVGGLRLDEMEKELSTFRDTAERAKDEFRTFLRANDITSFYDTADWGTYSRYFEQIENGSITAKEAIGEFKTEYSRLLGSDMSVEGGMFDATQITNFTEQLRVACETIEEMSGLFKSAVSGNVFSNISERLSENAQLSTATKQSMSGIAQDVKGAMVIKDIFKEIFNTANTAGSGMDGMYESVSNLVQSISGLSEIDPNQLLGIFNVFKSLGNMKDLSISKTTMENISNGLYSLANIPNIENLPIISSTDLHGFSNLKVSKASLTNLVDYLPRLTELDFDKLQTLSSINFNNLTNLKIPKGNLTGIEDLAKASQALNTLSTNTQLDAIKSAVESVTTSLDKLGEKLSETKSKGGGGGGDSDLKLLSEDANAYNDAIKKVNDTLTTAYANREKWNAAEAGSSKNDYSNYNKAITQLENLRTDLGNKTKAAYSSEFKEISKNLSESIKEMELAGERIKLPETLVEGTKKYSDSIAKANTEAARMQKNLDSWSGIKGFETDYESKIKSYKDLLDKMRGLSADIKDPTKDVTDKSFGTRFSDIKREVSEIIPELEEAARAYKELESSSKSGAGTSLPKEIKKDTDEYSKAIVKVNNEIKSLQNNVDTWSKTEGLGEKGQKDLEKYKQVLSDVQKLRRDLKDDSTTVTEDSFSRGINLAKERASELEPRLVRAVKAAKELSSSTSESFKPFTKEMTGYSKMVSNIEDQINSIKTSAEDARNINTKLFGFEGDDELTALISKYESFVQQYESLQGKLAAGTKENGISKPGAQNEYAEIAKGAEVAKKNIEEYINAVINSQKVSKDGFGAKEMKDAEDTLAKMQTNLNKWSAAKDGRSKDAYKTYEEQIEALRQLIDESEKGSVTLEDFKKRLQDIKDVGKESADTIRSNGEDIGSFSSKLSGMIQRFSFYFSMTRVVMMTIQKLKEMVKASVEIETAMARIQIVTGATDTQMTSFFESAANQAKELGKNITDVAKSIETFSRLGYSLTDATQLSKYATIMSNVGDTTVENATTGITSIIKGYGLNPSDAEHVSDVLINVGQKYAISAEELMEAFQRGGAALAASGTSFEESAALFAATNASLQNAATTGTLWKTVSARIRSAKTELEELGEDTTDLADGFSKYREELIALTGVDIMEDEDHYKSMLTIFNELASVWDNLRSDEARSRVAEILGGTRNLSGIMSTIQNIKDAQNAYNDALNSTGVSMEANNIYMETTEAHVGQLKASFQELSVDVFNSDFMKGFVDGARTAIEAIDSIVEHIGVLGTTITGVLGGVAIAKGVTAFKSAFLGSTGIFATMSAEITAFIGGLSAMTVGIVALVAGAAAGIGILMHEYKKANSYEGKAEKAKKSAEELADSKQELSEIESKISSVESSIEEINSLGGAKINKDGELAKLESTLTSLRIQKSLLEQINNLKTEQALGDAKDFLKSKSTYDTGDVKTVRLGRGDEQTVPITRTETPLEKSLYLQNEINEVAKERDDLLTKINNATKDGNKLDEATINSYKARAKVLEDRLTFLSGEQEKTLEDIYANYSLFFDDNGNVRKGYKGIVDEVDNFYKELGAVGEKYTGTESGLPVIDTSSKKFTKYIDDIKSANKKAIKEGNDAIAALTPDRLLEMYGRGGALGEAINELVQNALDLGIISDTSRGSLQSLANTLAEYGVISASTVGDLKENKDAIEDLNTYQTAYTSALSASTSATGLNTQNVKDLTDAYKHLPDFDPSRLFEKTANGIHLNEEYLKNLNAQIENEKMTELWDKLKTQTEERNKLLAEGGDTSKIDAEIESTRQLIAQYEGLTSAYNKWQSAKSATKERDMYQNVGSAYEQMKETLDQGWYGDEELNAYLDMMLSASQRTGDAYEDFQKLDRKIEGTSHSLMDYWQYDDDKNLVTDGMFDFLDDVNKVFGDTYAKVDENGKYTWDLTNGKLEKVAEHFGTTTEMIQMFERALIDAGATVILDSQEIDDLQGNLQKLQQAGQISSDIDLGFEASEMSIEDIQSKIKELENEKVRIEAEADTGEADTALNQLDATIAALKNQEVAVKIQTELASGKSIDDLLGDEDLATTLDIDTSQVEEARAMLEQLKSGVDVPVTIRMDESQFEQLISGERSENVTVTYTKNSEEVDSYQPDDKEATAKFKKDSSEPDSYQPSNKTATVIYSADTSGLPNTLPTITRTVNYVATGAVGPGQASGTLSVARANGTAYNAPWNFKPAYANGRVALNKDEVALVNELGTESIILICDFIQQCISNNLFNCWKILRAKYTTA